jgi:lipopolysaccharide export system permease protein
LKRLDKYLILNVVKVLILTEFAGLVMSLTIEFFDHMDIFTETFVNFLLGIAYLILKIPYYFNLLLPLAFLISMLIILLIMTRNNELIALRTSGISTASLMKPLIYLSGVLILSSFCLSEFIVPATARASEYLYRIKIRKEEPYVFFKNDKIWIKKGRVISNIDLFDVKRDIIKGFTLIELTDTYSISRRVDAKEGVFRDGHWIFKDVTERIFDYNDIKSSKWYPELEGLINEPPSVFKIAEKDPEEMGYRDLSRYIQKMKQNGHDIRRYLVDLYNKVSFPFINLIMVFAACAVGLRYTKQRHISKGIVAGVFLGMLYWVVHSISLAFGYSELFPPLFAAWLANILFFSAGMVGIITLRT